MTHTRFELGFTRHRKVYALSAEAFRLWVSSVDHAREQTTDGAITDIDMDVIPHCPRRGARRDKLVGELERAGLWERVEDGWQIHDFLDWQDSSTFVRTKRQRARERMRRVRGNEPTTFARTDPPCSREVRDGVSPPSSSSDLDSGSVGAGPDPTCQVGQGEADAPGVAPNQAPARQRRGGGRRRAQTPWPEDFAEEIQPLVLEWAREQGYPDQWVVGRLERMRDVYVSKDLRYADWAAASRNFLKSEIEYGRGPGAVRANGARTPNRADAQLQRQLERVRELEAEEGQPQ